MKISENDLSITQFSQFVAEQKSALKKHYEQLLAHDLSQQKWDGCFQRNVLAALEQAYKDAFANIQLLPFDNSQVQVENGLVDLTKKVLVVFDGFVDEFLLFVVDKHRTSCALSNFPDEHKPDNTYVNVVKRDIVGLWQNFALDVNAYFLEAQ
jgi:hypothetical protein